MYYRQFRNTSETLLKLTPGRWQEVSSSARVFVQDQLAPSKTSFNIAMLVQVLTLKTSLQIFFHLDPSKLSTAKTAILASEINTLWLAFKNAGTMPRWQDQHHLHRIFHDLIATRDPLTPKDNSMSLILPSYETTWRVVPRCFLETHFRPHHANAPAWRSVLRAFLHDTCATSSTSRFAHRCSAEDISKEALRFYPPTRRVYRSVHSASFAADIETLHRSHAAFSAPGDASPASFRPGRWAETTGAAFLAFGAASFACPARRGFGPRVVAVLVGALSVGVEAGGENGPGGWRVDKAFVREMEWGGVLDSGREAYDGMELWR